MQDTFWEGDRADLSSSKHTAEKWETPHILSRSGIQLDCKVSCSLVESKEGRYCDTHDLWEEASGAEPTDKLSTFLVLVKLNATRSYSRRARSRVHGRTSGDYEGDLPRRLVTEYMGEASGAVIKYGGDNPKWQGGEGGV